MNMLSKIAPGQYVDFLKVALIYITGCEATRFNVNMIIEGVKIEVNTDMSAQDALDRTEELYRMSNTVRVTINSK